MTNPPEQKPKSLNSFQIIGRLFSASIGVSSSKNRGQKLSEASAFAWLGVIAIIVATHYAFVYLIVYLVRASVH